MSSSICKVALALAFATTALSAVPGQVVGSGSLASLAHYSVNESDTCISIINSHPNTLTLNEFYVWNPQVQRDCSNLIPGENVCIRAGTLQDCGACNASN
ncbi:carbohydrate-binding module family 50 protein [Penicillium maclennaniae]|uniref:carbohydrate-binding module family 50 protein n=1 Tax=Penicillium maclennaniae TaxID=1343394 RepID=UPI0025401C9D|nr:carbohydrate-binding module family 50 protein [Penicillium maclennaniae]KAJ5668215.1 carbohydrate-binding module family 50 protein [Penicillium maclennaniae]